MESQPNGLRCICCNRILYFPTKNGMCTKCSVLSSQYYVYGDFDIDALIEQPMEIEREEYNYLRKEAVDIE